MINISKKNNLGNNHNSKKIKNNHKKNNGSDEENDEEEIEFSYQNFCKLKKQIFQFIENNSTAKEKKNILALIKANRYKSV